MADLKLGLQLGYWMSNPPENFVGLAQEAEKLGFDSVWTAEAYGSDALTPLAWIGGRRAASVSVPRCARCPHARRPQRRWPRSRSTTCRKAA